MHTVIRRYEGAGDSAEVARRAVEEFGPMLRDRPGFQGYYVVDAGDGVLATISVFDTEEAAVETTSAAAAWVRENLPELAENPPQVTAGSTAGETMETPARSSIRRASRCASGTPRVWIPTSATSSSSGLPSMISWAILERVLSSPSASRRDLPCTGACVVIRLLSGLAGPG